MRDTQKNLYKKLYGKIGENKAVKYLKKQGYSVLERNYRARFGEIDVIAEDGGVLVFIEVKSRSGDGFGAPAEAVDAQKRKRYALAAAEYLQKNAVEERECRFDVVEVKNGAINHIKDAFFA